MKAMAKLIPWRPWMTESHAQPMDTHSSWAFLANSAATTASAFRERPSSSPWHSHGPTATFLILTAFLEVQRSRFSSLPCYSIWQGQRYKERKGLITVPWRTPICLPWFGIKRATEEKPLELQPSGPLYFDVRYHQIQLLLIFSLPPT